MQLPAPTRVNGGPPPDGGRLAGRPEGLARVRGAGFTILAMTPRGEVPLDEAAGRFCGAAGRVALLLGTEGEGLTEAALARSDVRVRIPIAAGVDSLNVNVAAAIALHRLGRVSMG